MASRTRPLSSRAMKRRLRKAGWRFVRQCNSAHEMWESADGSFTHVTSFTSKMMDTRATAELLAKIEASQAATRAAQAPPDPVQYHQEWIAGESVAAYAETQVEEPMEESMTTALEDKSPVRGDPHRAYWRKDRHGSRGHWQIEAYYKKSEEGRQHRKYVGIAATRDEALLKVLEADEQWAKQEAALPIVPVTEHPKYEPIATAEIKEISLRAADDLGITQRMVVRTEHLFAHISDDVLLAEVIRRLGNFSADDGDPAAATLRGNLAEYRVALQPIVRHLATMEGTAACTGKDAHDVLLPPRLADVNCPDCKRTAHYKTVQWVLG